MKLQLSGWEGHSILSQSGVESCSIGTVSSGVEHGHERVWRRGPCTARSRDEQGPC